MTIRRVIQSETQSGITTTSDEFVLANTAGRTSIALHLTEGTPVAGAVIEYTLDTEQAIEAGSALWVKGRAYLASTLETLNGPVTALRVVASDGVWALNVLCDGKI